MGNKKKDKKSKAEETKVETPAEETPKNEAEAGAPAAEGGQPTGLPEGQPTDEQRRVTINAQYIKDLSFENPDAPRSLVVQKEQPKIEFSVDVGAQRVQQTSYEVELRLTAKASVDNTSLFLVELKYAGVFTVANIPEQELEPLLLVYCPNMLFPFARRVIADVTRDGGFPPLMVDPIDFMTIYQQRKANSGEGAAAGTEATATA